ncbi:MAG: TIGR02186 family protein [Rhodospirillaceae bacterium]|nr:TIGR02186 family protein [Rhodospirillales bacterium]
MIRVLALMLLFATPQAWAAEPLVADLSKHLVAITTGFAGTDVLLFGAVEEVAGVGGGDVVVVVRGPNRSEIVRRKARRAGIWVNTGLAEVANAPSFYRVAATRPLAELASAPVLERHQIGLDHLELDIRPLDRRAGPEDYRQALLRLKQSQGLYGDKVQDIGFLGRRLFRTDVHFPANVPVGTYLVEVYLIAGGEVVSAQTTPLVISKIGLGADLYDFAHQQAAAYGIIAIFLAASAGWAAAVVLRK